MPLYYYILPVFFAVLTARFLDRAAILKEQAAHQQKALDAIVLTGKQYDAILNLDLNPHTVAIMNKGIYHLKLSVYRRYIAASVSFVVTLYTIYQLF